MGSLRGFPADIALLFFDALCRHLVAQLPLLADIVAMALETAALNRTNLLASKAHIVIILRSSARRSDCSD